MNRTLFVSTLALVALLAMTACGGGGGTSSATPHAFPTNPPTAVTQDVTLRPSAISAGHQTGTLPSLGTLSGTITVGPAVQIAAQYPILPVLTVTVSGPSAVDPYYGYSTVEHVKIVSNIDYGLTGTCGGSVACSYLNFTFTNTPAPLSTYTLTGVTDATTFALGTDGSGSFFVSGYTGNVVSGYNTQGQGFRGFKAGTVYDYILHT